MKLIGVTSKKNSIKATLVSLTDSAVTLSLPKLELDIVCQVEGDTASLASLVGKSVVITTLPDGSHEVTEAPTTKKKSARQGSSCTTRQRDLIA